MLFLNQFRCNPFFCIKPTLYCYNMICLDNICNVKQNLILIKKNFKYTMNTDYDDSYKLRTGTNQDMHAFP